MLAPEYHFVMITKKYFCDVCLLRYTQSSRQGHIMLASYSTINLREEDQHSALQSLILPHNIICKNIMIKYFTSLPSILQ